VAVGDIQNFQSQLDGISATCGSASSSVSYTSLTGPSAR
jgi:hypothetical protein